MADDYLGPHLAFDRGIDRVTYARRDDTQSLPRRQEGPPSELGGRPQLETLLAQPTLEGLLEELIRPQLVCRDLLVPGRFQTELERAQSTLAEMAKNEEGAHASPEKKRILQRAAKLLASERDLRSLVQMYRSVLYQG